MFAFYYNTKPAEEKQNVIMKSHTVSYITKAHINKPY